MHGNNVTCDKRTRPAIRLLVVLFFALVFQTSSAVAQSVPHLRGPNDPQAATFFLGPIVQFGVSSPTNHAPSGYQPYSKNAWSAGVEAVSYVGGDCFWGAQLLYTKRTWEMRGESSDNTYDELGIEYVAVNPYIRWQWAELGMAFLIPSAAQATILHGSDDPTFIQFDNTNIQMELRGGVTFKLWGVSDEEFRVVMLGSYSLNNAFDAWQLHSSTQPLSPINGRLFSIQMGVHFTAGLGM